MSEVWSSGGEVAAGDGMQRRVARGLLWTIVDTWAGQALNLVVFVVLARLLAPVDFGLVALATVFVAFAQFVVDQGLGDALIQRPEIRRSHVDTAFWVAVGTGCVLTVALFLLAEPLAALLREPALAPILRVLSLTFVLSAFSSIQTALLRRQLAFRSLAARSIVAATGGGAIAIVLAVAGFGVWALVAQQLGTAIVSVVALWAVSPWRPGLHASRREFRELFSFGGRVLGSDILSYLERNVDNLLIGTVLGPTQLGFYALGYRILGVSQAMLVKIARKVTFPVFSRLQHDRARLVRAYFRVIRASSVVILPAYVGLALVAPELIVTLFGDRWAPSGIVAAILFVIGPVLTIHAFTGSLLNAAGHPQVLLRLRVISATVNVIGFIAAVSFGIVAVAAAFVIRGYLLLPLVIHWLRAYVGVEPREYVRQLAGIGRLTALMAAAIVLVKASPLGGLAPGLLLAAEASAGAAVLVAGLLTLERRLLRESVELVRDVAPRRARGARRPAGTEPGVGLPATGEEA